MTLALVAGCIWVLVAAITATLPMRLQMVPGLALLITAPILLVLIGKDYGVWVALVCVAAFGSMFRHPLHYLWRRARGLEVEIPPELRDKRGR